MVLFRFLSWINVLDFDRFFGFWKIIQISCFRIIFHGVIYVMTDDVAVVCVRVVCVVDRVDVVFLVV